MMIGVGCAKSQMKKISFIKNLMNNGHKLQIMALNGLKEFLIGERIKDERERERFENKQKTKRSIILRIMDKNLRFLGLAFRQAYMYMESDREKERVRAKKQRGIMMRI